MVEIITRYRADDGKEFESRDDAEAHERGIEPERIAAALCDLPPELVRNAILDPTAPGHRNTADALERAGYLIAEARRAAGVYKRAPKAKDDAAPETNGEKSGSNSDGAEV